MTLPIYQVDAFTQERFRGNPAAICPLPHWLDDATLQNIAIENNLQETGYFVEKDGQYEIRWFMPYDEIDLCGHATLAAAHVIFNELKKEEKIISFQSKSGPLFATKEPNGAITLDFPSRPPKEIPIPEHILNAFKIKPLAAYASRDIVVTFATESEILQAKPNIRALKGIPYLSTVITAPGSEADFVSRVFDPECSIPEDPVTGSAHASLVPYWAGVLGKTKLKAVQVSERRGELQCRLEGDRVYLSGFVVPYLKGTIEV
ncbi:MAG: PhzF family phenazine biosynthesis protein [Bacteroidota bacterium]